MRLPVLMTVPVAFFMCGAAGGLCGPGEPMPCDLDRLGCDDPLVTEFYLDSCPADVTGALEVEVGSGEHAFDALVDGGFGPTLHWGPQGGQHAFLGFRLKNPRLDVSPLIRVNFYLGVGDDCVAISGGESAACGTTLGSRSITLGSAGFELHKTPEGTIEEFGFVVFSDYVGDTPGLVSATVEDQCGRKGVAVQRFSKLP
jgi:hypothetical protein